MLFLIVKWIHILSAITALGANFTYPVWLRAAGSDAQSTQFALRGIAKVERMANGAYVLLLISGIAMMVLSGIPWGTPWVSISLALFILTGFMAGALYTPALRKQTALASKPTSPEYLAAQERSQRIGILITLLVVAIEFFMTVKPALWG
jgi:uncharacterized membrane protein